ncbi:MAG TPA: cisplatin damage response ATP-dependent DNA ligase [Hyphomicrobiaceae bacterium]|nr:cisplatin damage response ATP-dependent DNA ligase [Hyphomicrobiaceae bacterium]
MKPFAELLDRLVYTPQRNGKLKLMQDYFRATPDPDRGYALAALTDGLPFSFPVRRTIMSLMERRLDPELFRLSRDFVGDTAETVALMWPEPRTAGTPLRLGDIVAELELMDRNVLEMKLEGWLDRLDATSRWALLKLLTGALRVGVSARLAKTAVAGMADKPVAEVEEIWHGIAPPYLQLFRWLEGQSERPDISGAPVFRPLMLSHPLEDADWDAFDLDEFAVEWKWDGIRVQVASGHGKVRLYSRAGDDISRAFPDLVDSFAFNAVLDGELLVVRNGEVAPFNDLQQRLNRKSVTKRMLADFPAHIRFYDALEIDGVDLRPLPFTERRAHLEAWHARTRPPRTDISELLRPDSKPALLQVWQETRGMSIEGLMLKRLTSPYIAGRPKGHWFKWKRAALTLDCVLMYAQRGSGKRSSYYSDYTFGAWTTHPDGTTELVPVGKAYSGYTDAELLELDRWIRNNTVDRFGPVRAVTPALVLEVAFDAVQRSSRHKSGVAMRFPRINRIRWDKPAAEADRLETLVRLMG